jgi:hypothetical protein
MDLFGGSPGPRRPAHQSRKALVLKVGRPVTGSAV